MSDGLPDALPTVVAQKDLPFLIELRVELPESSCSGPRHAQRLATIAEAVDLAAT